MKDKEEELAKLQQQIDEASRNTTLEGENMLKDLYEQKKKLEEARDKFIKEHQKQEGNNLFDKQMQLIEENANKKKEQLENQHKLNQEVLENEINEREKEWERHYTDAKISELAKQLVKTGFVEIDGEVVKLKESINSYYVNQGEVFSDSSLKMQEFIDKLELAKSLYSDLANINKNLGVQTANNVNSFKNNIIAPVPRFTNFAAIPTLNTQKPAINIKSDFNVDKIENGDVEELRRLLDENNEELMRKLKNTLYNH